MIFANALPVIIAYVLISIIRLVYRLFHFRKIVTTFPVEADNISRIKITTQSTLFFVLFFTIVVPFAIAGIVAMPLLFALDETQALFSFERFLDLDAILIGAATALSPEHAEHRLNELAAQR